MHAPDLRRKPEPSIAERIIGSRNFPALKFAVFSRMINEPVIMRDARASHTK
jgi:hypothetical protein